MQQIKIENLDDIKPFNRDRVKSENVHENSRYVESLSHAGLDEVGVPTPPPETRQMLKDQKPGVRRSDHVNAPILINAGIKITPEMMHDGLSPDLNSTGEAAGLDQFSPIPVSN